jgi:hypothetical protein
MVVHVLFTGMALPLSFKQSKIHILIAHRHRVMWSLIIFIIIFIISLQPYWGFPELILSSAIVLLPSSSLSYSFLHRLHLPCRHPTDPALAHHQETDPERSSVTLSICHHLVRIRRLSPHCPVVTWVTLSIDMDHLVVTSL